MPTQNPCPLNKRLLTHLTISGTAALAGASASAQVVVTNVNTDIGYGPGGQSFFVSSLPGLSQFVINRGRDTSPIHFLQFQSLGQSSTSASGYLNIKATNTTQGFNQIIKSPAGQTWKSIPGSATSSAGFASVGSVSTLKRGLGVFTDGYFAFEFRDTTNQNQLDYGYIKASLTDDSYRGLNLHIDYYAYDVSGQPLATGAVPEPSAAQALAALSALTMGALGVRRMKALQG